jgi:PAS domain S-box-containing protein
MRDQETRIRGGATARLDNRDALLRNVVADSRIATFVATAGGELIYANRAFSEMLGYGPDECVGLRTEQLIHRDDAVSVRAHAAALLRGEQIALQVELRYLRKDGSPIWVFALPAILSVGGRPLCITVQVVDIDRLKQAQMAPSVPDSRWNSALEEAGLGLWTTIAVRSTATSRAHGMPCAACHRPRPIRSTSMPGGCAFTRTILRTWMPRSARSNVPGRTPG